MSEAKRADVGAGVLEEIQKRWSPRAFSAQPVPDDALRQLFDAARWAMSSFNEQPWRYVVATKDDSDGYERVLHCLNEFNREWAQTAPVLMLGLAKSTFSRNGKPNRYARHDLGAASAFLTLQASKLDLYVHQMAGILPDVIGETFDLPDDVEPVTGLAIGYLGDPDNLSETLAERERGERTRKSLSEIFFDAAGYGTPARVIERM
ncbi:nitroreductase [Longibacter salinarum]|uniref:Nitroreductase n=1 Tax=Longibacter salinarum TaxID=1850348 RepID=A0A2A8CZB9_9BACT|nr:nitroreductase [Longibacter salinarum]